MTDRSADLQFFLDAAFAAFDGHVKDPDGRRSILEIATLLERAGVERRGPGSRLPACAWLSAVLSQTTNEPALQRMTEHFQSLEPRLQWKRRTADDGTASDNFADGHANAMIVGPRGLEERSDVWLGVTIMAPNVRYPDHNHAPEETYLVLSDGEFRQQDGEWFSPGVGGTFYNRPNIKHAMRSRQTPLFAFWALRT